MEWAGLAGRGGTVQCSAVWREWVAVQASTDPIRKGAEEMVECRCRCRCNLCAVSCVSVWWRGS